MSNQPSPPVPPSLQDLLNLLVNARPAPGAPRIAASAASLAQRANMRPAISSPARVSPAVSGWLSLVNGAVMLGLALGAHWLLTSPVALHAEGGVVTLSRPTLMGIDTQVVPLAVADVATHQEAAGKNGTRTVTTIGGIEVDPLGLTEGMPEQREFLDAFQQYKRRPGAAPLDLAMRPFALFWPAVWGFFAFGMLILVQGLRALGEMPAPVRGRYAARRVAAPLAWDDDDDDD